MIFTSECTRNRLSAGIRPDPLWELTAVRKKGMGKAEEREGKEWEEKEGKEGDCRTYLQ